MKRFGTRWKDLEHDGKDVGTRCTHLATTVPSPVVRPTTVDAASGGGHVEQIQLGSSKKSREMSILHRYYTVKYLYVPPYRDRRRPRIAPGVVAHDGLVTREQQEVEGCECINLLST